MGPVMQIPPIGSRILGNEDDFPDSLINKPPGFLENRSNPPAPVGPLIFGTVQKVQRLEQPSAILR